MFAGKFLLTHVSVLRVSSFIRYGLHSYYAPWKLSWMEQLILLCKQKPNSKHNILTLCSTLSSFSAMIPNFQWTVYFSNKVDKQYKGNNNIGLICSVSLRIIFTWYFTINYVIFKILVAQLELNLYRFMLIMFCIR